MKHWYYILPGTEAAVGPVTTMVLRQLAQNGQLPTNSLLCAAGEKEWHKACQLRGIFEAIICPACRTRISYEPKHRGTEQKCGTCGSMIWIPAEPRSATEDPPTPPYLYSVAEVRSWLDTLTPESRLHLLNISLEGGDQMLALCWMKKCHDERMAAERAQEQPSNFPKLDNMLTGSLNEATIYDYSEEEIIAWLNTYPESTKQQMLRIASESPDPMRLLCEVKKQYDRDQKLNAFVLMTSLVFGLFKR